MVFSFQNEPGKIIVKQNKSITTDVVPKISVITPFYNSGKDFMQTYRCMLNQTLEAYEWIIVNDGSTDENDVALLTQLAEEDARIRVLHQENAGQSVAKNHGIRESKTEIIAFLDADDLIEPFYLEILFQALQMHPEASWSYTDLVGFAAEEYVWCKTFSAGRMTFNNILVNAAAFRKRELEMVGGFDEIAKHYDEDWALYLKLLAKSCYPVHVPVIGFWYRKSSTGMQQTVRKNEELRKKSDDYVRELAKDVDIHVKEIVFRGKLPENAVISKYSMSDKVLAMIMKNRFGIALVRKIYGRK